MNSSPFGVPDGLPVMTPEVASSTIQRVIVDADARRMAERPRGAVRGALGVRGGTIVAMVGGPVHEGGDP